jgi:hypothetical protein
MSNRAFLTPVQKVVKKYLIDGIPVSPLVDKHKVAINDGLDGSMVIDN